MNQGKALQQCPAAERAPRAPSLPWQHVKGRFVRRAQRRLVPLAAAGRGGAGTRGHRAAPTVPAPLVHPLPLRRLRAALSSCWRGCRHSLCLVQSWALTGPRPLAGPEPERSRGGAGGAPQPAPGAALPCPALPGPAPGSCLQPGRECQQQVGPAPEPRGDAALVGGCWRWGSPFPEAPPRAERNRGALAAGGPGGGGRAPGGSGRLREAPAPSGAPPVRRPSELGAVLRRLPKSPCRSRPPARNESRAGGGGHSAGPAALFSAWGRNA
ncbi:hypothetical protein LUU34_00935900 [Aix galericulata]|nr:hypothetical protein LUU34_00935900 [Aix galericulata]